MTLLLSTENVACTSRGRLHAVGSNSADRKKGKKSRSTFRVVSYSSGEMEGRVVANVHSGWLGCVG